MSVGYRTSALPLHHKRAYHLPRLPQLDVILNLLVFELTAALFLPHHFLVELVEVGLDLVKRPLFDCHGIDVLCLHPFMHLIEYSMVVSIEEIRVLLLQVAPGPNNSIIVRESRHRYAKVDVGPLVQSSLMGFLGD
jgi:hypothetical protein